MTRIKPHQAAERVPASSCLWCGYATDEHAPESKCPECGLTSKDAVAKRRRRARRRWFGVSSTALVLIALLASRGEDIRIEGAYGLIPDWVLVRIVDIESSQPSRMRNLASERVSNLRMSRESILKLAHRCVSCDDLQQALSIWKDQEDRYLIPAWHIGHLSNFDGYFVRFEISRSDGMVVVSDSIRNGGGTYTPPMVLRARAGERMFLAADLNGHTFVYRCDVLVDDSEIQTVIIGRFRLVLVDDKWSIVWDDCSKVAK
jgi:predicted nucleic acid-binding Zn ribbon protein